ncbi:uncharacterized protein F5147DRAFT_661424 [Suillus discolor]|uniref:F-box domain-containing protein n=1 Tax=Suillus discolor TaxID=1912936 RepID=A0A9P7ER35_9AGAM|nr:uncharacterized protein F5147DRAFT_661424 [Suillus discolor]KAG2080150.1 hypothetical protein F5147DRAFT_661424 [Suillus discolor]
MLAWQGSRHGRAVQDLAVEYRKVQYKTKAEIAYFRDENVGQERGLGKKNLEVTSTSQQYKLLRVNDDIVPCTENIVRRPPTTAELNGLYCRGYPPQSMRVSEYDASYWDEFKYKETYETEYWRSMSRVQVGRRITDRPYLFIKSVVVLQVLLICNSFRLPESVWPPHKQHHIVDIDTYQCSLECYMHALANLPANKSSSLRGLVTLAFTASNVSHWNDGQGSDLIFVVSTHPYVSLAEAHGDVMCRIPAALFRELRSAFPDNNTNPKEIGVVLEQLLPSFKAKPIKYVVKCRICRFTVIIVLPGDSSQCPSRKRHACASYLPWALAAFVMRDISKPAKARRGTLSCSYAIVDLNVILLDAWALGYQSGAAVDLCDGEHCNVAKPKLMKRAEAMTSEIGHESAEEDFKKMSKCKALEEVPSGSSPPTPKRRSLSHLPVIANLIIPTLGTADSTIQSPHWPFPNELVLNILEKLPAQHLQSIAQVSCFSWELVAPLYFRSVGLQINDKSLLVSTQACLTLLL